MNNLKLFTLSSILVTFSLLISIPTLYAQNTNPRLASAFIALQAWKHTITSDPKNFTGNWVGCEVCTYKGVYCAPTPDDPNLQTVAGIDLNHANIAGTLPEDLGLLTDLALFHINSNRFTGPIPYAFAHMRLLYELDLSNNLFCGPFPSVVLCLSSLKFLDIRFNHFYGSIPPKVFDLKLDALFLNNNNFSSTLSPNMFNSTLSVFVLANNLLDGCFPEDIPNMGETLHEIILMNAGLKGCLPTSVGRLTKATVFDISFNELTGPLPDTIGEMKNLEQLNVAHNKFIGGIPESICCLPSLQNFTYSYNYFCTEPAKCLTLKAKDDKSNCLVQRPMQRTPEVCHAFLSNPPSCSSFGCPGSPASQPPPPPPPPLPAYPTPEY